jgi:molybdopterin molybdotransferase
MPEFLQLLTPPDALARFLNALNQPMLQDKSEVVSTETALGRVASVPVRAPHPLPSFPRSTVDGYALRAADTYGASDSIPAYFQVTGEVLMGTTPEFVPLKGQCALIHTGGMLPEGTDAVVMLENTQQVQAHEVEVLRAVAVGENVLKVGEDVSTGEEVLAAGKRIQPADMGGLMALGITRLSVVVRPRIGIISSGDEIVPPEVEPSPGQVRDVNAFTLSALIEQAGGEPVRYGIVSDQADILLSAARTALGECDAVIITAGSSASVRDLTSGIINRLGSPGVLVHGINVRPGKPTILGVCDGKAAVGLPGNPVSALVIAMLFVAPLIERLLGLKFEKAKPVVKADITINLPSQAGREDWIAVRLQRENDKTWAEPVFGKSNLIFTLARADGLVRIPPDATGLAAGENVDVYPF